MPKSLKGLLQVPWPVGLGVGPAPEQLLEGLPELWAKDCIDNWIEGGVKVAKPLEEVEDPVVYTVSAQRHHEGQDKKGQPAKDKRSCHNGQRFCGLFLPFGFQRDVLLFFFPLWLLLTGVALRLAGHVAATDACGGVQSAGGLCVFVWQR